MAQSAGSTKSEERSPKLGQKSPRARNTLNQRQSRARRKTYVSELEGKIRWFESAGVQATREVQVAAQQVVEDNRRLRWILQQRFGVDERELTLLLSDQSQSFAVVGLGGRCPRCGTGVAGNLEDARHHMMPMQHSQLPSPPYLDPEPQPIRDYELPPSQSEKEYHASGVPQQPSRQQHEILMASHSRPSASSNSMPCEEAAAIIASMRGGDAHDIWPELGCSSTSRCTVDNVRVMSLLDQDDGMR